MIVRSCCLEYQYNTYTHTREVREYYSYAVVCNIVQMYRLFSLCDYFFTCYTDVCG